MVALAMSSTVVAEYTYRDADGAVLGCTTYDAQGRRTRWAIRDGHRTDLVTGNFLPPYRLDDVVRARAEKPRRLVVVTDDEASADLLWSQGIVATTFATAPGSSPFPERWTRDIRGGRLVVLATPDTERQAVGLVHVVYDLVKDVRLITLESAVSDWLAGGHTAAELRERIITTKAYQLVPLEAKAAEPNGHENGKNGASRFSVVSIADLLAEPASETDWLVDGLVPAGGLVLVGAKPKVGKSTLVRTLVAAVGRGLPFLGRQTVCGGVVYLALEEKRDKVREHFRVMVLGQEQIQVHVGKAPQEALPALLELIATYRPRLAVIDPVFKFRRLRDIKDYAEVSNALEELLEAARSTDCAFVATHHNTKAIAEGGDELLGSTAIFGAVDTALLMERRPDGVRLAYTIQRYGEDLPKSVVQLDDHGAARLGLTADDYERSMLVRRIVESLRNGPRSEPQIREDAEVHATKLALVLRDLLASRRVERAGAGKKGDPYIYTLAAEAPQDWTERVYG